MSDPNTAAERVREAIEKGDMLALAIQIVNSLDTFPPYTIENLLADVVKAKTAGRVIEQAYAEQSAEIAAFRGAFGLAEKDRVVVPQNPVVGSLLIDRGKGGDRIRVWPSDEPKTDETEHEHPAFRRGCNLVADRMKAEIAKLRAKLAAIISQLQRKLQPTGSPPPGDEEMLATWIIDAARDKLAKYDDATPIDEAWLRSIGFSIRPDDQGYTLRIQLDNYAGWIRYLECCDKANLPDTPWEIASYCKDGTDERAMLTDKIATRAQLRHLLAALGGAK